MFLPYPCISTFYDTSDTRSSLDHRISPPAWAGGSWRSPAGQWQVWSRPRPSWLLTPSLTRFLHARCWRGAGSHATRGEMLSCLPIFSSFVLDHGERKYHLICNSLPLNPLTVWLHRDDIYTRVRVQSVSVTRCQHSSYLECVCSQIVSVNSTLLSQPAADDAGPGHVTRLVRQCDYSYICHGPVTLHHAEVTTPLGWTSGDTVAANLEILPLHKYSSAWTVELETKVRKDFTIIEKAPTRSFTFRTLL